MRRRRHPRHPEAEKPLILACTPCSIADRNRGHRHFDGEILRQHKPWLGRRYLGHDVLASMRAFLAIGHTRYSTAGDSALLNAQPIMVQSNKARSRSLTMATWSMLTRFAPGLRAKARFSKPTAIRSSVHLIALLATDAARRHCDALRRVEGAFRWS